MTSRPKNSTEIRLASRPDGGASRENFEFAQVPLRSPDHGEVLVVNQYLSVEPYMRERMDGDVSWISPFEIGEPLTGAAVGVVVESRTPDLEPGDVVTHDLGWRDASVDQASAFQKVRARDLPASAYLGGLGGPGLTAYVGLVDVGGLRSGDTVFVSGAAGAVGSMAGQFARLKGAKRVIGSAGTAQKVAYLTEELGFDAAFNYRDGPVDEQLAAAAPDGIDLYFDNIGGDHLQAAIASMNDYGRITLCGAIAGYDGDEPAAGPNNFYELILKRITARGFISFPDYINRQAAFLDEAEQWLRDGDIVLRETVVDGIDGMPQALIDLFTGKGAGKVLVRLSAGAKA